jgi:hypothetical protein
MVALASLVLFFLRWVLHLIRREVLGGGPKHLDALPSLNDITRALRTYVCVVLAVSWVVYFLFLIRGGGPSPDQLGGCFKDTPPGASIWKTDQAEAVRDSLSPECQNHFFELSEAITVGVIGSLAVLAYMEMTRWDAVLLFGVVTLIFATATRS